MEYRNRIGNDSFKQSIERAVCANDIIHWVNTWCWTYDPREKVSTLPFDLFPKQAEFLLWLKQREELEEDGLAEKSRDVGFTWLCVAYDVHGWLNRAGYSAGFGSRKLDLVDKIGDPDTIFEKIRFLLRNLPYWMLPHGFELGKHDSYCKIVNPENGATITGEGGDQIGRGGRKTRYTVDESAFIDRPQLVDASLSQTTRCRIDVSTPNGQGNSFHTKRFGGKIPVFTLHWRDDPRKDDAWYAKEKARLDPVTVAQEIDIDYSASIEGICIPAAWVRAAVDFNIPGISGTYPLVAGFDVADGGKAESVMVPRRGPNVMQPETWAEASAGQAAHKARDFAERLGIETVFYDAIGVGTSVQEVWDYADVKPKFKTVGVKWGAAPTTALWPSGKTSEEMFSNLRAELWWIVRTRFEKTWQVVNEGAVFPPDELISIPNDGKLIAQLSSILYHYTNTGKIQIESKADLSKRGVASPDRADALCYSESPAMAVLEFF